VDIVPGHAGAAVVLVASLVASACMSEHSAGGSDNSVQPAATVSSSLPEMLPNAGELLAAARRDGSVSVIVTLRMAFTPQGDLPDQQSVTRQHRAIRSAQTALLHELEPYDSHMETRYTATPQLALQVDAAALRHLAASARVKTIQQNKLDAPAGH